MKSAKNMLMLIGIIILITVIGTIYAYTKYQDSKKPHIDFSQQETLVTKLTAENKLVTYSQELSKVVDGNEQVADVLPKYKFDDALAGFLFKDNIKIYIHAKVNAGFDLSKADKNFLKFDGKNVDITLPAPEILDVIMLPDTQVVSRDTGVLTKGNIDLESQIRTNSSDYMKQQAIDKGLLDLAKQQAKSVFEKIVSPFGYSVRNINFEADKSVL